MDGLLVIDKPAGPTSHDIVQRVRKLLGFRRVGHGGTLDPAATGVLLVTVGQATRFFPYLSGHDKSYEGMIRLGFATDTFDSTGRQASPVSPDLPSARAVSQAMKDMQGEILQMPPPYSAKKVAGTPGYKLARAEREFTLKPVPVEVRVFELRDYQPPIVVFKAVCSSGTYVRSLANDLGRTLGCGAHLHSLRRTAAGPYTIDQAVPLARLEEAVTAGRLEEIVRPLEELLPDVPAVVIRPEAADRVRHGAPLAGHHLIPAAPEEGLFPPGPPVYRLIDQEGRLLALARVSPDRDRLLPYLVIG